MYELKFSLLVGTCNVVIFLTSVEARADIVLKCSSGVRSALGTTFKSTETLDPYFVYWYREFEQFSDRID